MESEALLFLSYRFIHLSLFLIFVTDASRFVIGTEDGLYTVEISSGFIVRVDRKQIHQVRVLKDEQLVIVISGMFFHLPILSSCLEIKIIDYGNHSSANRSHVLYIFVIRDFSVSLYAWVYQHRNITFVTLVKVHSVKHTWHSAFL